MVPKTHHSSTLNASDRWPLLPNRQVFCNLVPGVEEEELLRLRPEFLHKICSDDGASAAAARLVRPAR